MAVKKEENSNLVKPSELPVYPAEKTTNEIQNKGEDLENSILFKVSQSIAKEGCEIARNALSIKERCEQFVNTGLAHSQSSYMTATEFLREKNNIIPRVGAIASGTLFGYVLASRKGFFKRTIYATTCGSLTAAICYPEQAGQYGKEGLQASKKYAFIGYHFLNGVTKDLTGYELPSLPANKDSIINADASKKKSEDSG